MSFWWSEIAHEWKQLDHINVLCFLQVIIFEELRVFLAGGKHSYREQRPSLNTQQTKNL